jgi:hypothetical protein
LDPGEYEAMTFAELRVWDRWMRRAQGHRAEVDDG